tara:strand:+ start:16218 stop:16400 length:183 start_codon:yes stop_codon:yes gene_type:complete
VAIKPPADRLICADEPLSPGGDATDEQAALYIGALIDAGANCRDALAWIKDWADGLPDGD